MPAPPDFLHAISTVKCIREIMRPWFREGSEEPGGSWFFAVRDLVNMLRQQWRIKRRGLAGAACEAAAGRVPAPRKKLATCYPSSMPASPEVALRAEKLSKVYRSGDADLVIFDAIDLEVHRGEMLALVGESGAGKSTLLHLLGGLDRPTSGTIYYGTIDISRLADSELANFRNREIGFVWQIHYLLPEFTALENVMMPLLIRGVPHGKAASDSQ